MAFDTIFRPDLFAGRTIVVTGGGTGIGRCTAHELAALGADVVLIGRRPEPLQATVREIVEDGGKASFHTGDVRGEERIKEIVDAVLQANGRIDGLVNNAGGQFLQPIRDMKVKGWEAVISSNLTAGFLFSREVYIAWMENNGGAIVNMIADVQNGWPYKAHSGAARAGMLNFTQSAAAEWGGANVRVNAIAPGGIAVDRGSGSKTYTSEEAALMWDSWRRWPAQRLGTESEVSAAIVFLLSPAAAFITGAVIHVDGGSAVSRSLGIVPQHAPMSSWDGFHRSIQVEEGRPDEGRG